MATIEIDGFINHFKILSSAGHEAKLNIETRLGEIWVTLDCKVGRIAPPLSPVLSSQNHRYRSPSYFRRQARRREERENMNMSINKVSTPVVDMPVAETAREVFNAVKETEQSLDVNSAPEENINLKTTEKVDELILEKSIEEVVEVDDVKDMNAGMDIIKELGSCKQTENVQASKIQKENASTDILESPRQCCFHIHLSGSPPPDGKCCQHRCRPNWTRHQRAWTYGEVELLSEPNYNPTADDQG